MKIQINTEEKIIKIEDKVNLTELWDLLNKMFPDGEWREFSLETNTTIIEWQQPIVINYPPYPNYYVWPWVIQPSSNPYKIGDPISVYPNTGDPLPKDYYVGDPLPGQETINICSSNNDTFNSFSEVNNLSKHSGSMMKGVFNFEIVK